MADETSVDQPTDYGQQEVQRVAGASKAGHYSLSRDVISDGVGGAAKAVLAFFFKALGIFGVYVLKGLYTALGELDPAFGAIAATVVGNMFDVNIDGTAFASMTSSAGRKQVGHDVGAALLKAMQGDAAGIGPGELQPGVDAAENFLGVMANLAIEGWAMDLVGEAETLGYVTNLGELNDRMANIMGLGRLSRTVLRPFVNTLIATPALWQVNKQYRPKMLSVSEAIAANIRGDVDDATLIEICARDGYGDDAIAALRNGALKTLPAADLQLLVNTDQVDQDYALQELQRAGHPSDRAQLLFGLEDLRDLHKFELEMLSAAVTAYADHRIDEPKLLELLSASTVSDKAIARLHELAAQRRICNAPHLSEADVINAVKRNVLNITDYAAWLSARGYSDVDAVTKELTLQDELNEISDKAAAKAAAAATRAANAQAKLQAQTAKRDAIALTHAHWSGTLGEAERLVVRNVMPPTQYQSVLEDHGINPGDASALVTVAVADRDARAAAQAKKAAAANTTKNPTLSLAALERAVLLQALTLAQFDQEAAARGYSGADVALMHDELVKELADRAALQAKRDAAGAGGGAKALSLAQDEQAVVDGAMTIDAFRARVVAMKFGDVDVAAIVAHVTAKLADHQLALERHALAEAKLAASHVSLANEETAVVDGILTMADFQTWLTTHGFDAGDVAVMSALLEEKIAKKAGG